jgi:hypothetical protein
MARRAHNAWRDDDFPSEKMVLLQRPLVAEPGQDGTRCPQPGAIQCATRAPSSSSRTTGSYSPSTPTQSSRPACWSPPASPDTTGVRIVAPPQGFAAMIPTTKSGLDALTYLGATEMHPSRA